MAAPEDPRLPSCSTCFSLKRRCDYPTGAPPCSRCARLARTDCRPPDPTVSRRRLERLKRASKGHAVSGGHRKAGGGGARRTTNNGTAHAPAGAGNNERTSSRTSGGTDSADGGDAAPAGSSRALSGRRAAALAAAGKLAEQDSPSSGSDSRSSGQDEDGEYEEVGIDGSGTLVPGSVAASGSVFASGSGLASGSVAASVVSSGSLHSYGAPGGDFGPLSRGQQAAFCGLASPTEPLSTLPAPWPRPRPPQLPAVPRAPSSTTTLRPVSSLSLDPQPLPDVLLPSIAAYWAHSHPLSPAVHRTTFERAFAPSTRGSPLFGPHQPNALLFAMAALGTRFADVPGLSDADRIRAGRAYCDAARDMLLNGYYGRPEGSRAMTDMEAVLVLLFLYNFWIPSGLVARMFPLLERTVDLVVALCADPARGNRDALTAEPRTADEWVVRETKARAWIGCLCLDILTGYTSGREPYFPYFSRPMVLPAHDGFFDMASPEEAFNVLYRTPGTAPPAVADFSPLFASDVGDAERVRAVREAVGSSFSHRAYSGTLLVFGTFLRHLKHRLRAHALAHRVSPLALMTQDPALDRPAETAYRLLNAHVDALVAAVPLAFPPALRPLFESGDASAFFASWPAYFPSRGHAHSFFMTATMLHSLRMESLFEGDASRASPDMFSSPAFLSVLEGAAVAVRMLRSQMADDPRLRWGHLSQVATALRAGNILLAAVRVGAAGMGYEEEVGVVARFLDVVGWTYRPLALKAAKDFHAAVAAAGISAPPAPAGDEPLPDPEPVPMADDLVPAEAREPGPGAEMPVAFARAAMAGDRAFQGYIR